MRFRPKAKATRPSEPEPQPDPPAELLDSGQSCSPQAPRIAPDTITGEYVEVVATPDDERTGPTPAELAHYPLPVVSTLLAGENVRKGEARGWAHVLHRLRNYVFAEVENWGHDPLFMESLSELASEIGYAAKHPAKATQAARRAK